MRTYRMTEGKDGLYYVQMTGGWWWTTIKVFEERFLAEELLDMLNE